MNPWAWASRAARSRSSRVASGRARRRFSATVAWKRNVSWATTAIWRRRSSTVIARTSMPPTETVPSSASKKRSRRETIVVLPAPDRPTRATVSPGVTSNESPSRAAAPSGR